MHSRAVCSGIFRCEEAFEFFDTACHRMRNMMEQIWFEMPEIRRRFFEGAVWIPLRATITNDEGESGFESYKSEFFGLGSLMVPISKKADAETLEWMEVGISHNHQGYFQDGVYVPTHIFYRNDEVFGEHLVLDQRGEKEKWHLSQDFVITLGLSREKDVWVRPDEGYVEVVRLKRNDEGRPNLIEVRASHLKDYLCARSMALYLTSYHDRVEIASDKKHISWENDGKKEKDGLDFFEGRILEIHEGGMRFGEQVAVFHAGRIDVDPDKEVPSFDFPGDDKVKTKTWTRKFSGKKLYRIEGELWRREWVNPASKSPIVREDKVAPTVSFIIDAEGKQEDRDKLVQGSRWLWFSPNVVSALLKYRGGSLVWYTRDTGSVGCVPTDCVHFGINKIGLVNVYAKDIALLPDWEQRIWSGFNVSPEGGVSEELLDSQMKARPAHTLAPEGFLAECLEGVGKTIKDKFGIEVFQHHEKVDDILEGLNRFRSCDDDGLFSLAKDLARIIVDDLDPKEIQTIVAPPKGEKWGSLKSLEKLLETKVGASVAREVMGPLHGIYNLRLADAHLPTEDIETAFKLVGIDRNMPMVEQGFRLLHACVSTLIGIGRSLEDSSSNPTGLK